jgi:hypothetical protein
MNRFRKDYRPLTPEETQARADLILLAEQMETIIDGMKEPRYKALALTHLEETVMWAIKSLTA